jgi:hypothetical protein
MKSNPGNSMKEDENEQKTLLLLQKEITKTT